METESHLAPHRGGLILALGIISLVVCQFLGIAPWLMGRADIAEMNAGRMDPSGRSLTDAGKILGIVSVALAVFTVIAGALFLVFGLGMAAFSK